MKTTYDSIPIMTHIVGSKSRKAMYLVMPTSMDGNKIYKNAWIPTRWTSRADNVQHTIAWEHITDEYVELSMREVTPAMLIETLSTYGVGDTLLKSRIVDNKVQQYVQLQRKYIIHVPKFAMQNLSVKYTKLTQVNMDDDLFPNEHSHYSIAEETARKSFEQHELQDRPDYSWTVTGGIENSPQLEQWLKDNPEYINDPSIL